MAAGWRTTSPEEQADDAAALLDALGVGPAAVVGTSSGGNFALCMLIRHAEAVRGAILHGPNGRLLVTGQGLMRMERDGLMAPARRRRIGPPGSGRHRLP